MKERVSSLFLLIMLLVGIMALAYNLRHATSQPTTVFVDDDNTGGPWDGSPAYPYPNITSGLEHAAPGDTVFVYNGTYHEHLNISQPVNLVGQNPVNTIIDGDGELYLPIVWVGAVDVTIKSFTLRNTSSNLFVGGFGVLTSQSRNVTIQDNIIEKTAYGIQLVNTNGSRVLENQILNNHNYAIDLRPGSSFNFIVSNQITGNPIGVYIEAPSCRNNTFYRNNFQNSTNRHLDVTFAGPGTAWDNGAEGNYWDDYQGIDSDGNGVGDTDLPHLGIDSRPLIEPWHETRTYSVPPHVVTIKCNFTVASFTFNQVLRQISFYITGPSGWSGYCNATIPTALLGPENASEKWLVMLGKTPLPHLNETVGSFTLVSFTYSLRSALEDNSVLIKVGVRYPLIADFEFTPDPASIAEPVNFTDRSTSPNGTIRWRQWNFGDGTVENTTSPFITHNFTATGLFNVILTVGDNNTLTDSVTRPVRVRNLAPAARFTFSPTMPFVGIEVEFNASTSSDLGGAVVGYQWIFGDGNVTSVDTPLITHRFRHVPSGGHYKVNLTVTDNEGAVNSTERLVPVEKGVSELVVEAPSSAKIETSFTVNATLRDSHGQWPLPGEQIAFSLYDDGVQHTVNSTTNTSGAAAATFFITTVGDYSIKAEFIGSSDYVATNSTTVITVTPLGTNLVLTVPEEVTLNEAAAIFAALLDEKGRALSGATVEFAYYNGTAWELLGSSQTNQSGVASVDYIPQKAGTYTVTAAFGGDETHTASADESGLTVIGPETDYTIYIALIVVGVALVTLAFILWMRKKPAASTHQSEKR